jgi:hypothetical protein
MAARVLHFGSDDCYRIMVLRAAGYDVQEATNLIELKADLDRDHEISAVLMSEGVDQSVERAAAIVRSRAPVILFRRSQQSIDETGFDLIFETSVRPEVWLREMADLIKKGLELLDESRRLRVRTAALRAEYKKERELRDRMRSMPRE